MTSGADSYQDRRRVVDPTTDDRPPGNYEDHDPRLEY